MAGAFSIHGMVVIGVGRAPVPHLPREGRLESPSLLDTMCNSLMTSSIMAHRGDGDPLRVEPMKAAPELLLLREAHPKGTIGTSRGKERYKYPFLACQLSVFSAPANYGVEKIACNSSEVVL
jgi:hypothetical protein